VLDAQVLLDPFEKEFDLPAVFVQGCDGGCRRTGVVGQKDQSLAHRLSFARVTKNPPALKNAPSNLLFVHLDLTER